VLVILWGGLKVANTNIFDLTFGETGNAVIFFGGQWWLVGLFLLLVFAVLMYSEGAGGRNIAIMFITGIVVMLTNSLFTILATEPILKTIMYFMLIFGGWYYYRWTNS
jgi:hypothetical protein